MSTENDWIVQAAPLDPGSVKREEPDLGHWGCLGPILVLIFVKIFTFLLDVKFSWILFLPSGLAVLGLIYLNYRSSLAGLETRYLQHIRGKRQSLEREAEHSAENALRFMREGRTVSKELESHLVDADSLLQVARDEFSARAFAPFWDAVEAAAIAIGQYRNGLDKLAQHAESYHWALRGKQHTFPSWSSVVPPVVRPDQTLADFRSIVRQGQTDFEFSNIFEHRRTREALIAGFKYLGAALDGLSHAVETKLDQHHERLANLERSR